MYINSALHKPREVLIISQIWVISPWVSSSLVVLYCLSSFLPNLKWGDDLARPGSLTRFKLQSRYNRETYLHSRVILRLLVRVNHNHVVRVLLYFFSFQQQAWPWMTRHPLWDMKLLPALLLGLGVTGQQTRRRHSKRQIEDYQPYYDDEVLFLVRDQVFTLSKVRCKFVVYCSKWLHEIARYWLYWLLLLSVIEFFCAKMIELWGKGTFESVFELTIRRKFRATT